MRCYKDKTWCPYYKTCKHGKTCLRALTPKIIKEAITWWGSDEAPVSVYLNKPECYNEK